ncbi:MAG: PA2778 family cysteine peptidase [Gammaproteobacteria bacterium]|nr:PA2778 family cysteine peptidase [Gammaproteobacteria bacterium]
MRPWLVLAAALVLSACASFAPFHRLPPLSLGPEVPAQARVGGLRFIPQELYQCGPATLAMALAKAGRPVPAERLADEIYLPARQGSLQAEILSATRRRGFVAYPLRPALAAVLREVAAGTPVVVLQDLGLPLLPRWHYALAIGYELVRDEQGRDELLLHSGTQPALRLGLRAFDASWARAGRWAMVVAPPGRLPATAEEIPYVEAVVALERNRPAAARRAYATALKRWPANLAARLGLGNSAYALGDWVGAEAAYRRAARDHPRAGDAWNNLAQLLYERDRRAEAKAAAQRAVRAGGPRLAAYRQTLAEVQAPRPASRR